MISVDCIPVPNGEEFPLGDVAGSRWWRSMTRLEDVPMATLCTYRSRLCSDQVWGPALCFSLVILVQLLEGNSPNHCKWLRKYIANLFHSGHAPVRNTPGLASSEGGNPHRDVLRIPGHVLLIEKNKTKNFPLCTGTERHSLSDRTSAGNTVVPAPVAGRGRSPHSEVALLFLSLITLLKWLSKYLEESRQVVFTLLSSAL